jgi:hypothetical protein
MVIERLSSDLLLVEIPDNALPFVLIDKSFKHWTNSVEAVDIQHVTGKSFCHQILLKGCP